MITIEISQSTKTHDEMVDCLEHIADLIKQGYTSGFGPDWSLSGDEEGPSDKEIEDAIVDLDKPVAGGTVRKVRRVHKS